MDSCVQDLRILGGLFLLFTFFFSSPSPSVSVLPSLQRETQDSSPHKEDICFVCRLRGGQEHAVEDDCHTVGKGEI